MARWSEAEVSEAKILNYLLSEDHPVGGAKAVFFRSLGYSREEWTKLRDELVEAAQRGEVTSEVETAFGTKYVVDVALRVPAGGVVALRTVWITDQPEDRPRLVTAYPS